MYISWRATQFLPDVAPSNVRAVVLCASTDFQPWSSSVSAAKKDGIDAYRLPLERYARFDNKSKYLPLSAVSSILRSYFRREDLGVSIRETVERQPKSARSVEQNEIELFEQYKCVIREAVAKAEAAASYEIYKKRDRTHSLPKKPKVHRYSREERRVMREKLQAEQS
ncbi:hypothetical protein Q1695_008500 [Nippostrongylus brasiliensis]|nr:hypothetical protein Q1695_008500 [Nippostrongylus brasiliensis]